MIPSARFVALCGAWVAASGIGLVAGLPAIFATFGGILALAALIDLFRARSVAPPQASRRVAASLPLGHPCDVVIRLSSSARRPLTIDVFDHHPVTAEVEGLPRTVSLAPGGWAEIRYRMRPRARGAIGFGLTELRITSPWGLWQITRTAGSSAVVRVHPDYIPAVRYALLAVDHRTSQLGIRRTPRRGAGTELHSLRDYRAGDTIRQIDWKATSRRRRLISREYQDERDQQVIFLLDCGRSMRSMDDGEAHFDHALKSLLLLAHVALRQGDSVGLLAFGGSDRFIAPMKGPAAMKRLLDGVYDLQTSLSSSDYAAAASRLLTKIRKRALVVMITNLGDEEGGEVASVLRRLRRRHLVLLASLRESALDRALDAGVESFEGALRVGAIHHYLAARGRAHRALAGHGIRLLDIAPGALPVAMVNRYLDIKRSGAL